MLNEFMVILGLFQFKRSVQVRGQTCLIQFGDGTTEIAPFKRLKKLFGDPEEEEPPPIKKAAESSPSRPQQTCGSCGAYRVGKLLLCWV